MVFTREVHKGHGFPQCYEGVFRGSFQFCDWDLKGRGEYQSIRVSVNTRDTTVWIEGNT
jgi:hypothetical protein